MAAEKFPKEISAIRKILLENPDGLTIRSISAMLGMNRNSTAKYLEMLQMQGGVTLKRSGPSKIYYLADKLPATAILKLTKSYVIIFDMGLTAADINDSFLTRLKISKEDILGKPTGLLPFSVQCHPVLPVLLKEGVRKESRISAFITIGDRTIPCNLTIGPVFFENGNSGVFLTIDAGQKPENTELFTMGEDDTLAALDGTEFICRFAPDGTFTYVNKAYCDLLHKTKTELIGHTWHPAIPESEGKKIKTCLHSLDATHPVASLDIRVITKTGDLQWQRWKFRYLPDRLDQPAGYQATGQDITDLKKLELKVSKSSDEMESLIRERQAEIQDLNKQIYEEITSHEKTHFQLQFTQFAMDAASYMITWIGRDGRFIYLNRQAQQVLGYEYRDLITKKFQDLQAGIFPAPWEEIWGIIKREQQYLSDMILRTNKGAEIPVEIVFNYLEFKDVPYCCCFIKDISERKELEEALRESRQILTAVLNSITVRIFWKDRNSVYLGCNTAFARDAGFEKQEDVIGKDDYAMGWHNQAGVYREDDRAVMESRIAKLHHEETQTTPSGKKIQILTSKVPLRNVQGEFIGVLGTYIDITQRHGTEAVLMDSEREYRAIADTMYAKICIKDASLAYVSCNQLFARDLGIADEEIAGKTDFDFFPRALAEKYRAEDRVIIESGATGRIEGYNSNRKDSGIPALNAPVKEDLGNLHQVSGIYYDITLRKKAEDQFRKKTLVQLQLPGDDLPKTDTNSHLFRAGRQS